MINDTENDKDTCVIVNDIEYRMMPELKWHLNIGEPIGYAGNAKNEVLNVLGDTKMNFILISQLGFWDGARCLILCRTDYEIPQPSAESVTKIVVDGSNNLSHTITEKEIIGQLFEALASNERDLDAINYECPGIGLTCYSDNVPGAVYLLGTRIHDGKIMCGSSNEGYVEISLELLETLAGQTINAEELLDK